MATLGSGYASFVEAPTTVPATSGGQVLNAGTFSAAPMYSVDLCQGKRALPVNSAPGQVGTLVGSYAGWQEPSPAAATGVLQTVSQYHAGEWSSLTAQPLPLPAGITASLRHVPGQAASPTMPAVLPTAVVSWQEGRWAIAISSSVNGQQDPTAAANTVAACLHQHFLPVPDEQGTVRVAITGTPSATQVLTTVAWQDGTRVYATTTDGTAATPRIRSARGMAVSLRPYPISGGASHAIPSLTLEQLTVTANALIITTTHGTTPNTYWDPYVTPGSPSTFRATLVDTSAGSFPTNQTRPVTCNWATSETLVPQGNNLVLVFALKPGYAPSSTSIGAADLIQVSFQHQ